MPTIRRSTDAVIAWLLTVLVLTGWLYVGQQPARIVRGDPPGAADEIDKKLVEFRKLVKNAASRERTRELLTSILALVDEALAADEYASAIRVAALAVETGASLENEHISTVCTRRRDEVANIAKEAKKMSRQIEKLKKSPDDPTANFEIGRFRCTVRNDWERGLPLLAKGNNAAWSAPAKSDLASPSDPDEQIAAGEGWARLAAVEKGPRKLPLARRAVHWYRTVLRTAMGDVRKKAVSAMDKLPICYITDLDEVEVTRAYSPLAKYGDYGGRPIAVNGFRYPDGLGLHPTDGDEATVKYKLDSPYKTLVAGVAINDLQLVEFKDTVIFLVVGDGEVLWKSPPVTSRNVAVFCEVDVRKIKVLELKTRAPNGAYSAHAAWLDPCLLK